MITDLEKVTLLHAAALLEQKLNMSSYGRTIRQMVQRERPDVRQICDECNGSAAIQRAFGPLETPHPDAEPIIGVDGSFMGWKA